jgi:glyoxylase-like metal-dependent hydrolase (beta-lactamase superfamily II)
MVNGLFIDGTERIMIDGRLGEAVTLAFIRENRVGRYFISHFHIDHAAGAWRIAAETDCQPVLNETAYMYLHSRENLGRVTGYSQVGLHDLVEQVLMPAIDLRYLPGIGSYAPAEIEAISQGHLQVIPTPGHSPGHYCLYAPASESVFTGDLGLDRFGPWYGFPNCRLGDFLNSIDKVRDLKAKRLFSSHGQVILDSPDQALAGCRTIIETRHAKILRAWEKGLRTVPEIAACGVFYENLNGLGKRLAAVVDYWQQCMVQCHLVYAGLTAEQEVAPKD